jgi:hypothetical protein
MTTKTVPARDVRIGDRIVVSAREERTRTATVTAVVTGAEHTAITIKDRHGWTQRRFAADAAVDVRR